MEKAISIRCAGADNFDIEDLHPFQDDIKTMTPSTLKKLENVIISQGFSEPIAVWQNDGRNWILNGHQRHTALQSLRSRGWFVPPVPVAIVEADDEDEARKKVITLASQFGDFNQDHLLEFVAKAKLDNDWLKNNARLAAGDFKWPTLKAEDPADNAPGPGPQAFVKRGELFILGDHRLLCGDAINEDDISFLLDGNTSVDMVFTDPPYGVNERTNRKDNNRFGDAESKNFAPVIGDDSEETARLAFPIAMERGKTVVYWGANNYSFLPKSRGWIVWDKRENKGHDDNGDSELAWTNVNRPIRNFYHLWKGMIKASEQGENRCHPTQKPIELAVWCFENYGKPATVLDLFAGSGSTLIACEKTKRRGFMMEIDPLYCGVILDRWQEFTGKIAHRDDGETWDSIKNVRTD